MPPFALLGFERHELAHRRVTFRILGHGGLIVTTLGLSGTQPPNGSWTIAEQSDSSTVSVSSRLGVAIAVAEQTEPLE